MAAELTKRGQATRALLASGLVSFFSGPATFIYPFGIFAIAIAESSGVPKQQIAATIGPVLLLPIPLAPVTGWIIQRFHKPTLAVLAMVGAAAGLLLLSAAPTTPALFFATLATAFILASLAGPGVTSALVLQNFDKGRGLALGVVAACTGLGMAVIPVLDSWMITHFGWRQAYAMCGGLVFVGAVVNVVVLRGVSSTQSGAALPATHPVDQSLAVVLKESFGTLRKDSTFWIIVGYFFLLAVVANAMPLHLPLILQERGAPTNVQALSLTVTGITMLVARPTMGWVLDTFPVRWVLVGMTMGPLAGVLLLLAGGGAAGALVSAIGFGMALGGEVVALNYIISRAFPLERYGSTFGWCMLVLGLAAAGGPIAISTLVHFGGSYEAPLIMMLVGSLLALFICFFLNDARVRRPTKAVLVQQGI